MHKQPPRPSLFASIQRLAAVGTAMPHRARLALLPLLLSVGPQAPAIDLETRVDGLEARLEALTRRVQAVEAVLGERGQSAAAASRPKGAPVWAMDGYVGEAPLRVLQSALDRKTGQIDLLLDVVSEPPDSEHWGDLVPGTPVPLAASFDPPLRESELPVQLHLKRATSISPGSRIHVTGRIPPEQARSVHRVFVSHAPIGARPDILHRAPGVVRDPAPAPDP